MVVGHVVGSDWPLEAPPTNRPHRRRRVVLAMALATATAGSVGAIVAANGSSAASTLPPHGSVFVPTDPVRLFDTRSTGSRLAAGSPIDVVVAGSNDVPSTAVGVMANLTVTGPSNSGYLVAWPTGSPRPGTSNLNFSAGQTVPNLASVRLGTGGRITIALSGGSADVIVDLSGYYVPGPDKGDKGDAGAAGAAGAIGPAGAVGASGPTGLTGPVGSTGAAGAVGPQGNPGPIGPAGTPGAPGIGLPGTPGPAGAAGPVGPVGPAGPTGATGTQGPTGSTGSTGGTGAQGPAGGTPILTGAVDFVDPTETTGYISLNGHRNVGSSSAAVNAVFPMAGTISGFAGHITATAQSVTVTLLVNNVATAATCTITPAATSCGTGVTTVTVAAGDLVAVKIGNTQGVAISNLVWTAGFLPS